MRFEGIYKNLELKNDSEVNYWVITSYGHVKERFETFTVLVGFKSLDSYLNGKTYNQDSSIEVKFYMSDSLDILSDISSGTNPELAIWKKIISKGNLITRDLSQINFKDCDLIFTDNELVYIKPENHFINKNIFTSTEYKNASINDGSMIPIGTGSTTISSNTLISIGEKLNINLSGKINTLENETVTINFSSNGTILSSFEFNNDSENNFGLIIELVKVKNNLIYIKSKIELNNSANIYEVFTEFNYSIDNILDISCGFITPSNSNNILTESMTIKLN